MNKNTFPPPWPLAAISGLTAQSVLGSADIPPAALLNLTFHGSRIGPWTTQLGNDQWVGTPQATAVLDSQGCTLLPGFIDVHIHGSAGADVMEATPHSLETISRFVARHGVTAFYATTVTASHADTLAAVRNVAQYQSKGGSLQSGARILGVHLEGPYISPQFPGAQNPAYVRPPNIEEFEELLAAGPVRMITLAPEEAGAAALIEKALTAGVHVVLGHTAATFEQASAAIDAGISQATHTYNAMSGLHHRQPGTLGAVLSDDRIYAQLIADGIHVHAAAMQILGRCKGPARILLISDAIQAAGMAPGRYTMGGLAVIVQDGTCRLEDGTLAGSVLTLDVALRNFLQATSWSLAEAWPLTSLSQAQALGIDDQVGRIEAGLQADLTLLDADKQVVATIVGGQLVYLRDDWRLHLCHSSIPPASD